MSQLFARGPSELTRGKVNGAKGEQSSFSHVFLKSGLPLGYAVHVNEGGQNGLQGRIPSR